jgi:hypothetical protein
MIKKNQKDSLMYVKVRRSTANSDLIVPIFNSLDLDMKRNDSKKALEMILLIR